MAIQSPRALFELGNSLREAREREGLDFAQLEADTRIRAKYLRALEEELFEVLPAESYARGFLEVYAKRLGLDSQLYVDEFDSRFARAETSGQTVRHVRTARRPHLEASAVILGLVAILGVTVLVIAAWQFSGGESGTPTTEEAPPATPPVEPAVPPATPVPPPAPVGTPADGEPALEEPRMAELQVTAVTGPTRVTIRRNGPRGQVIFADVLPRGETRTFTGERLHAAFRAPRKLSVEIGGEQVSPLPRRLIVTVDGWRLP